MAVNRFQSLAILVIFAITCLATGIFGGLLTNPSISSGWYDSLVKPTFTPPAWVFGPVWTFLYLLMAVSAWLVWSEQARHPVRIPLLVFFTQLVLNVLWSAFFFGARKPGWAFVEIVVLWGLILVMIILFWKISRPAALLLLPYSVWVLFAMVLNGTIWWMNRGLPPVDGGILS
jgi:tryptophan-rich sensory protein